MISSLETAFGQLHSGTSCGAHCELVGGACCFCSHVMSRPFTAPTRETAGSTCTKSGRGQGASSLPVRESESTTPPLGRERREPAYPFLLTKRVRVDILCHALSNRQICLNDVRLGHSTNDTARLQISGVSEVAHSAEWLVGKLAMPTNYADHSCIEMALVCCLSWFDAGLEPVTGTRVSTAARPRLEHSISP